MLQLRSAHLHLYFFIGIIFLWRGVEPKAFSAFPFEFELQPPHVLLWLVCLTTAAERSSAYASLPFSFVSTDLL